MSEYHLSEVDVQRIASALFEMINKKKIKIQCPEELVTIDKLSKELSVAKQTIYNNPGKFCAVKVGGRNLYPIQRIRKKFNLQ